jgi:hypothetical protein
MVPALLLTYFVGLIGILAVATTSFSGWAVLIVLLPILLVDRELFALRNVFDGDDASDEPHRETGAPR